jgi:hypothetical protein
MNVTMWEHSTFDSHIFGCSKIYYSNYIIIINFVQTLIGLKKSSLSILALKAPNKIFMWFREFIEYTF